MGNFKLSAQLFGHTTDVRAVSFPASDVVLTASRDRSVRVWKRTGESPPVFVAHLAAQGTDFVNSLAFLKPSPDHPGGLVLSGGKETIIDVRPPTASPSDNAFRLLVGHAHNVCTIDVAPSSRWFVSGGWDGQARVWATSKWETDVVLHGHDAMSVWAVLAYDDVTVMTGCADRSIRIFHLMRAIAGGADPISTIQTPDIVRALCSLAESHPSGASFASAGNDGVIRLWRMNGEQVAELHGHDSFVYSLALLPTGEVVSSGEDRTVRVWKGTECIQTITLPAISVWAVAACKASGDIVAGSSDGVARVFTRSLDRVGDVQTLKEFDEAIKSSSIPQQQVGQINKEKLPGPNFLTARSGTKEGQVQMIREEDGSISAHTWSMSQQAWVNVGTVVDSAASSGKKVEYNGHRYDYVFDVAIEEGQPSLKLPYNLSENPFDTATKFINDNGLSINYLDQIAHFITQNTQGATIGNTQQASGADPLGTESRYMPGDSSASSHPNILPQKGYLTILAAKYEALVKRIVSLNAGYKARGRKDISLSPSEEMAVAGLASSLESGASVDDTFALSLVIRCLGSWPYSDRLALIDLLRCLAASPAMVSYLDDTDGSILDIALKRGLLDGEGNPSENLVMLSLRVLVNIFKTEEGRLVAATSADSAVKALSTVLGVTGEPIGKFNRNVQIAASTLALNYAVMLVEEEGEEDGLDSGFTQKLGSVLAMIVKEQTDGEVVFRALVGLGTLVHSKKLHAGMRNVVHGAMAKTSEERVKSVGKEILGMLP